MHDPYSTILNIRVGKARITLYHKDPCTDGTDDSCGRFMRARHGDESVFEKIKKAFDFNINNNYWFYSNGLPKFSTAGIVLNMYREATYIVFKSNIKKRNAFLKKHLVDLLHFSENPTDSIGDTIENKYGQSGDNLKKALVGLASVVYADILRKNRKWYQHPNWHFSHWVIETNFSKRK